MADSSTLWTVAHKTVCLWDSPGKNTGVGTHSLLQGIFPAQEYNPGLLHCRQILYNLSHQGSPRILEWVCCLSLLQGVFLTQELNQCLLLWGRFFTSWATGEAHNHFGPYQWGLGAQGTWIIRPWVLNQVAGYKETCEKLKSAVIWTPLILPLQISMGFTLERMPKCWLKILLEIDERFVWVQGRTVFLSSKD